MQDKLGSTFTQQAQLYDEVRPHYPRLLFDDLAGCTRLTSQSSVLEVGSGTGQATEDLITITPRVTCIEPGQELFEILRGRFPQLSLHNQLFEDFSSDKVFDVIFSATAWHWINPDIGYRKAHELLQGSGYLVTARHFHHERTPDAFHIRANQIYEAIQRKPSRKIETGLHPGIDKEVALLNNQLFRLVKHAEYPWEQILSIDEYINLRNTYYEIISLTPEDRAEFERQVRELASREFAGRLTINYTTTLNIAQKIS